MKSVLLVNFEVRIRKFVFFIQHDLLYVKKINFFLYNYIQIEIRMEQLIK